MKICNYQSGNMVVQQNKRFSIKGFDASNNLTAKLINTRTNKEILPININNDDQFFILTFAKIKGSFDKYLLEIRDDEETLFIDNIYFGDVFLSAGQSNMSYSLGCVEKCQNYVEIISSYNIYCLNILENDIDENGFINRPAFPKNDISNKYHWQKVNQHNIKDISALSIMFAIKMAQKVNYPIGIICSALGGVSIDSYIPYESCKNNKKIYNYLSKTGKFISSLENYNTFKEANYTQTAGIYNEKIAPLNNLYLKAIIWYQGENSCYDYKSAKYYQYALYELIKTFRKSFNDVNLPIILTEIADTYYMYGDSFGYIYIQEILANIKKKNVFYIPTYDIDTRWLNFKDEELYYHPIHPRNKEKIAKRYCDIIYNNLYLNKKYFYPYIINKKSMDGALYLTINYSTKGLKINANYFGFTIAGKDNIYYSCKAIAINKNTIKLYSDNVKEPLYYTYGIMQYPIYCNCKTIDNLPLIQSRSKMEKISLSTYLLNQVVYSCDYLTIRENNFGYEVGGSFDKNIFEPGEIFKSGKVKISLDKKNKTEGTSSILYETSTSKKTYFYVSIKVNFGLSGCFNHFDMFKYLLVDIKGNEKIEFHGIVFRKAGAVYKLPLTLNSKIVQYVNLNNKFNTYAILLNKYQDGSEGTYDCNNFLNDIVSFELYFRSKEKVIINIDNIRLTNNVIDKEIEVNINKKVDSSILLPLKQNKE